MAPSSLEGWFQIFFLPKTKFDIIINLIFMNPRVIRERVPFLSDLIERVSSRVPELNVNCLLDFIPIVFDWFWFCIVTLRENLLIVCTVRFQESYVEVIVNVTEVRVAIEVESVVLAVVVNLCNWERSQPSRSEERRVGKECVP